jgi:methylated-DNA-[protein]-cysteine S-methyltransferase
MDRPPMDRIVEPPALEFGCAHLDVPAVGARLWALFSPHGLRRLSWQPAGSGADVLGPARPEERALPEPYAGLLRAYFAGEIVDPATLPVDVDAPGDTTPFRLKVWQALRQIPRGQVRSYAAIARAVGSPRALRAVGGANGKNPIAIVVPCHRVVEANMQLGGYTGGVRFKRYLLELEGARIEAERVHPGQLMLTPGDD